MTIQNIYKHTTQHQDKKNKLIFKNGQKTWIDIFSKRSCRWPGATVKETQSCWSFSSVQFSRSVVSDSLRPHESQHARPPCPSQTPRVYSNSCPSSRWCHPAISSSVVPFSSCLQSLPSIRVFSNESILHMRWQKCWGFSFSISPSNEHPGLISFRVDWLDLLAVQGTLKNLL